MPTSESVKDLSDRCCAYWSEVIALKIEKGYTPIVVASGSSIACLMQYLDKLSNHKTLGLQIPSAYPIVCELDEDM
jgi:2,3-bisphosphoglycerate-dependent phosphoglycerate mutase